jgi:hypothetical protein
VLRNSSTWEKYIYLSLEKRAEIHRVPAVGP